MKQEPVFSRRFFRDATLFFLAVFCFFLSGSPRLFSASIINEGQTLAKVNLRSTKGIVAGGSLKPGQNLHLKSEIAWIEHVPEGSASTVSLKIIENDGRVGRIDTPGGRYTFQHLSGTQTQPAAEKEEKPRPALLASGYAENNGNLAMLLSLVDKNNHQKYSLLLAGQKTEIPRDTVEVIVDQHGWTSGDVKISLLILMPDGKEQTVQTPHAVVRIKRTFS